MQMAHANVEVVLPIWLRSDCPLDGFHWNEADDGWLAAMRSVFFDWHPRDCHVVGSLVDALTGQTADANVEQLLGPLVFQLMRLDPVFMGKVVDCWMREIYPIWHEQHGRIDLLNHLSSLVLAGRTAEAARYDVAATINRDENFVEVELVGQSLYQLRAGAAHELDALRRSNVLLALNVDPFRRLLAARVLQDIADRL
jgi:hypothetical protein